MPRSASSLSRGRLSPARPGNCAGSRTIGPASVNDKTIVEGDINGNRVADFQIQLTGLKSLTVNDFIL